MNRDQYELKKRRLGDVRAVVSPPAAATGAARPTYETAEIPKMASQRPLPGMVRSGGRK